MYVVSGIHGRARPPACRDAPRNRTKWSSLSVEREAAVIDSGISCGFLPAFSLSLSLSLSLRLFALTHSTRRLPLVAICCRRFSFRPVRQSSPVRNYLRFARRSILLSKQLDGRLFLSVSRDWAAFFQGPGWRTNGRKDGRWRLCLCLEAIISQRIPEVYLGDGRPNAVTTGLAIENSVSVNSNPTRTIAGGAASVLSGDVAIGALFYSSRCITSTETRLE